MLFVFEFLLGAVAIQKFALARRVRYAAWGGMAQFSEAQCTFFLFNQENNYANSFAFLHFHIIFEFPNFHYGVTRVWSDPQAAV